MGAAPRRRQRTGLAVVSIALLALGVVLAFPAAATSRGTAETGPASVSQVVLENQHTWTPTKIILKTGDSVTVTASGLMHFGGGKIRNMAPPGIAFGPKCDAINRTQPRRSGFPAKGLSCWSLIARVSRAGNPIEVGNATTFRAPNPGELWLGLNDNYVSDNTGQWKATVRVSGAATTPGYTTPATPKKSSNTGIFVLVGVAVLVVLLLLLLFSRLAARRRRHEAADLASEAAELPEPAVAAVAGSAAGLAPLLVDEPPVALTPFAAPEPESIDVNIFEVEFSNGLTMRVGYNHFPEGTELRWRINQNQVEAARGSFVTKGGGSTNHVETITLGVKLIGRELQPDGADVQFDWAVNGVPFGYSVRRDPNC
jgi:hypothetical protein